MPARRRTPLDRQHPAIKAIRELTAAWVRKDAQAMAEQLSEDITELGPAFTMPIRGKRQFFSKYRRYLTGSLRIEQYRMFGTHLVPITSRLVLVYFSYRMRTRTEAGKIEDSRGYESMLVQKYGRTWKLKFIHWHRM